MVGAAGPVEARHQDEERVAGWGSKCDVLVVSGGKGRLQDPRASRVEHEEIEVALTGGEQEIELHRLTRRQRERIDVPIRRAGDGIDRAVAHDRGCVARRFVRLEAVVGRADASSGIELEHVVVRCAAGPEDTGDVGARRGGHMGDCLVVGADGQPQNECCDNGRVPSRTPRRHFRPSCKGDPQRRSREVPRRRGVRPLMGFSC